MSLQKFDNNQEELKAVREKITSFEGSLQSTNDTIYCLERDLHTSDTRFGWFEYKLEETEHKLGVADLKALRLKEVIDGLNTEVEFQKEEMVQAEDEAKDRGIDVGFKIFR